MLPDFVKLLADGILAAGALAGAENPDAEEFSDGECMRQIANGSAQAFERLYDRHSRPVYSLLLRITRDRGRAEDLLQEIFLTLWQQASHYDPAAQSVLPWLLVVARHRALDGLRSATTRREHGESEAELDLAASRSILAPGASPEAAFWQRHALDLVYAALDQLSDRERQVIEMAYFEGYTQSEISERLAAPLGTVKTWARSGLAKLREAVR